MPQNQSSQVFNSCSLPIASKSYKKIYNAFELKINNYNTQIFDITLGAGKHKELYKAAKIQITNLPKFELRNENFFNKHFGQDIDFKENQIFSDKYKLSSKNETRIREFFNYERLKFFENLNFNGILEANETEFIYYETSHFDTTFESYDYFIEKITKILENFDEKNINFNK